MPQPNPRWSSISEGSCLLSDLKDPALVDPSSCYSRFLRHQQKVQAQTLITWALHHAFYDMPLQRDLLRQQSLLWTGSRLIQSLHGMS